MGCKYSDIDGTCTLFDPDFLVETPGRDDNGYCLCEDDENPSISCEDYESDEC